MGDPDVQLHAVVARVAAAVAAGDDDQFAIPELAMVDLAAAVVEVKAGERKTVATHLIALAVKFERTAKEHTGFAVAQIAVLLGLALGSIADAEKALAGAGVAVGDDVQRAIGAVESKIPVGAQGRPAGSMSPLAAQLDRIKKP